MLAYRYDGLLEPLESAKDDIFPQGTAKPDRDEKGRVIDLLTTPPHEIVIVTTGICPTDVTTPKDIRKIVADTGARIKPGDVTANTTVLVVGSNPNRKKLNRATELLTPTVDFPGSDRHTRGTTTSRYRPARSTPHGTNPTGRSQQRFL